jgi:hypothetical protein
VEDLLWTEHYLPSLQDVLMALAGTEFQAYTAILLY